MSFPACIGKTIDSIQHCMRVVVPASLARELI